MAEYNCINCKYGNTTDDYEHCGNCDKGSEFVKMTNADHIRSMTDEELAEFFARKSPCAYYCNYVARSCSGIGCKQGILEWLKSEAKE